MPEPTGPWRVAISPALSLALGGSCTFQEEDETVIIQIQTRASRLQRLRPLNRGRAAARKR